MSVWLADTESLSAAFETQCIASISLTVLLYDYCLTFSNEVNWIWRAPKKLNLTIFLYFLNRYVTLLSVPLLILQYFWQNTDPNRLDSHFYLIIFSQVLVAAVLIQRAYAIYGRSRWVLAGTCVIATVAASLAIWSVVTSPSLLHSQEELLEKGTCMMPTSLDVVDRYMPAIISAMVLEVVAFVLTLAKSIQHITSRSILMEVLLSDGIFYFCAVMLAHFGVILSFYIPEDSTRGNLFSLANCLNSSLICRLILHLRDPSLTSHLEPSHTEQGPTQNIFSTVVLTGSGAYFNTDDSFQSKQDSFQSKQDSSYDRDFYSSRGGSTTDGFSLDSSKSGRYYRRGDSQV